MEKRNQPKVQTKKKKKCDTESEVKDSDDYDNSQPCASGGFDFTSEEFRSNLKKEFGKEILKLAVDELRDEFKQIAIEGGKHGAHVALHGDSMLELQDEITKKEAEIKQLKIEKRDLENELNQQKIKNKELELLISQKEEVIRTKELQLQEKTRLLKRLERERKCEQELHAKKVQELETENKILKQKQNDLKGKLLAKEASNNVAKVELEKLRAKRNSSNDDATKRKK